MTEDSNRKNPNRASGQWNADVISNKLDELKQRLINSNIDVTSIHESKLLGPDSSPKPDPTPKIPGYQVKRKDKVRAVVGASFTT